MEFIETKSTLVVARGRGRGQREMSANGCGIPFGIDENVLELDSNNSTTL